MLEEVQALLATLKDKVVGSVRNTLDQIGQNFAPGTGVDLFTAGLSAIIDALAGAVDLAIDVFQSVVASMFEIVKKLLRELVDFSNQEIVIPFLSDLYRIKVGDKLTIASLGALLVAVPTHVVTTLGPPAPQRLRASRSAAYDVGVAAAAGKAIVGAGLITASEMLAGAIELIDVDLKEAGLDLVSWPRTVRTVLMAINLVVVRVLDFVADVLETFLSPLQAALAAGFWLFGEINAALDLVEPYVGHAGARRAIFLGFCVGLAVVMFTELAAGYVEQVFQWNNTTHVYRFIDAVTEIAVVIPRFGRIEIKTPATAAVFLVSVALIGALTLAGGIFKMFETVAASRAT